MMDTTTTVETIAPVVRQAQTRLAPAEAFRLFTERVNEWWPLPSHSVWGDEAAACRMETQAGGRFYETHRDGRECEWGRVLAWEPPRRLVFSFYPGRTPEQATEVEVIFEPDGAGTRLILTHRGWENRGEKALAVREGYVTGWAFVLGKFEAAG